MFTRFRWSCLLLVGTLLAAGPAVQAQEQELLLTLDEEFSLLAEQVPGFGGLYLDEEGTTHVYLQDLSRAREVQDLGERVEVHQGAYDFRDLFAWKREVRDLMAEPGVLSLDIDERRKLQVNPADPRISVTGYTFGSPVSGSVVGKTGRTTGCTLGAQKDTCQDVNVWKPVPGFPGFFFDSGITMLCQNRVSTLSQPGDSGSPVYIPKNGNAILAGLLWGGNSSSFVYSPLLFVHAELGLVIPETD